MKVRYVGHSEWTELVLPPKKGLTVPDGVHVGTARYNKKYPKDQLPLDVEVPDVFGRELVKQDAWEQVKGSES